MESFCRWAMVGGGLIATDGSFLHVFPPKPMGLPHIHCRLYRNVLHLREKEVNEGGHDDYSPTKKVEQTKFQTAKQRQKNLLYDKRKDHVHRHIDSLPDRPNLKREELRRHKPPQRSPRPGDVARDIGRDERQNNESHALVNLPLSARPKLLHVWLPRMAASSMYFLQNQWVSHTFSGDESSRRRRRPAVFDRSQHDPDQKKSAPNMVCDAECTCS